MFSKIGLRHKDNYRPWDLICDQVNKDVSQQRIFLRIQSYFTAISMSMSLSNISVPGARVFKHRFFLISPAKT